MNQISASCKSLPMRLWVALSKRREEKIAARARRAKLEAKAASTDTETLLKDFVGIAQEPGRLKTESARVGQLRTVFILELVERGYSHAQLAKFGGVTKNVIQMAITNDRNKNRGNRGND